MNNRRIFLMQGAFASAAMLMPKPFMSFGRKGSFFSFGPRNDHSVTLLHTNDLHNHLKPVTHDMYSNMGGFEETVGIISKIKNEKNNVILVDAGDIFCGNMHHRKEYGTILQMMHSVGYDAALLGNRDYEAGTDFLQDQWPENDIPLVTSNYSFKDNWLRSLQHPYKIVHKGAIKIGIVGAGINMKGLVPAHVNDQVQYTDPVKKLVAIATMLKKEKKCQLVICLSHLGYKNKNAIDDITLAGQSKNIDVIVGGHSHTFMRTPQIVLNQEQQEVIINHAGYGGILLGNMKISFDGNGNRNQVTFNNLVVGTENNKWINRNYSRAVS